MRIVVQRVTRVSVEVDTETVAEMGPGLLLLVGIALTDTETTARRMARKCAELRVFAGDGSGFDRSLLDTNGEALVVSQFTLLADVRRGRRPSFAGAASGDQAAPLVGAVAQALRELGVRVQTGRFGAMMLVESVNDGPVTIVVDSDDLDAPRR